MNMTSLKLGAIATIFVYGLTYSPLQHAADRPKPSWQMTSVIGTYFVEVDGKQTRTEKTVNFFLDGTFGRGRVCLETPTGVCDSFEVRLGGLPEPGRFRISSLADHKSSPTGARIAVLDTTTGKAVKCSVQLKANVIGNTVCSLMSP